MDSYILLLHIHRIKILTTINAITLVNLLQTRHVAIFKRAYPNSNELNNLIITRPDSLETTAPYKFFTYLLTYLRSIEVVACCIYV